MRVITISMSSKLFLVFVSESYSEEVEMLARNLGCRLIRTSVQEDINVSSVFRYLATKCHQIMMQQYNVVPVGQPTISELHILNYANRSD